MIVSWDGSGHALAALRDCVGLLRENSFEHVEIVLREWPPVEIARWEDIRKQQVFSDDVHDAAGRVVAAETKALEDVLRPLSQSIASSTVEGVFVDIILEAAKRTHADLVFLALGRYDPAGVIREAIRATTEASHIPVWVIRASGTDT